MLWLSDDDGDPPWWMWLIVLSIGAGSIWLIVHRYESLQSESFSPAHFVRGALALCVGWIAMRFWFWFDKS